MCSELHTCLSWSRECTVWVWRLVANNNNNQSNSKTSAIISGGTCGFVWLNCFRRHHDLSLQQHWRLSWGSWLILWFLDDLLDEGKVMSGAQSMWPFNLNYFYPVVPSHFTATVLDTVHWVRLKKVLLWSLHPCLQFGCWQGFWSSDCGGNT